MQKSLVVFLIFIFTSVSATAQQLTKADLQSLEAKVTKVHETVIDIDKRLTKLEITVTEMDKRLSSQIAEMDKRLSNQIAEVDRRFSNQIVALDTFIRWAIGLLILVVLAVIALPQIFGYLRDKQERQKLQERVEQLEQEVAQLRTRIITP